MPKHKLAHAMVGILVMPGLIYAGYPDVPRSHWAAPAVDKVAQSGVMTSRSDGSFHGNNPATRYEVASAIARAMAEMENRLVAEGHAPQDIVPYIERINLYVADEIDHLKQSQKELRATVNELLERIERREAHSTPLPPPCPPMAHPHEAPVPQSELRTRTEVSTEQRIYPVEGSAPVNVAPTAPQNTGAITRLRARVSDGKIRAVEGATTVTPAAPAAPVIPVAPVAPSAPSKPSTTVSDEAAWDKSTAAPATPEPAGHTSASAVEKLKQDEMKVEDEAVAADESQPDIGWSGEVDAAKSAATKTEAPKSPAKAGKSAKGKKPQQTSKAPVPRAAPIPMGTAPEVEMTHGAVVMPGENPFGPGEHDAAPVYPAQAKKAHADKAPATTASVATSVPMEAAEILDTPDLAPTEGAPTDEQLSNWSGTKPTAAAPAAAPIVTASAAQAPAAAPTPKQAYKRSAKAQSLLEELRSHRATVP